MSEPDLYASCDGRPRVMEWRINRHLFYTFEVDTEEAERLVPDALEVVELRPGVALMSVGLLRYEPGHFHPDSPVFDEMVGAIHVAPDLSVRMPVPTMTFSSFAVLSDSRDFVDGEETLLFTPARRTELRFHFTDDQLGGQAEDDEGPILSVRNEHPEPRYAHKNMWGQHFTNTKGLQHGIWQWDGSVFEHMKSSKGWELFDHSFWAGLDLSRVRRCYRQMMLEPDTLCTERFFAMRPVAGAR